jgi:hypothetical protein
LGKAFVEVDVWALSMKSRSRRNNVVFSCLNSSFHTNSILRSKSAAAALNSGLLWLSIRITINTTPFDLKNVMVSSSPEAVGEPFKLIRGSRCM